MALTSRSRSFETEVLMQAENLAGLATLDRELRSRRRPAAERRVDTIVATELKPVCIENQNGNPGSKPPAQVAHQVRDAVVRAAREYAAAGAVVRLSNETICLGARA